MGGAGAGYAYDRYKDDRDDDRRDRDRCRDRNNDGYCDRRR
ncbi:hypothetical protein [Aerophototrophica crusticola]